MLPTGGNHAGYRGYGGNKPATVFVSRSLDYDAVSQIFNANRVGFTAAMATGAPDSSGRVGYIPTGWMPDTRRYGLTNWLELDYATPITANKIRIYQTQPSSAIGEIVLIGISGSNVARVSMPSALPVRGRSGTREFDFPITGEPIKTLQLNFGTTPPSNLGIDAVELVGTNGSAWATDARASSDNSASAPAHGSGRTGVDTIESLRAELPVSEWSENWLAYTPFDAVVLNTADFNSMPAPVTAALHSYLQVGGNIVVFGRGSSPETWRTTPNKLQPGGPNYSIGFGQCTVISLENPAALDATTMEKLRAIVNGTARYWESLPYDGGAANGAFPVVENLKIPVRGIVIIMLAFVILIGPVNIILLNRRKRRTWMLWTIPAISFVTTLIVFAYSLLREGITPDTRHRRFDSFGSAASSRGHGRRDSILLSAHAQRRIAF